jgi:hypothetical protein
MIIDKNEHLLTITMDHNDAKVMKKLLEDYNRYVDETGYDDEYLEQNHIRMSNILVQRLHMMIEGQARKSIFIY